MLQAVVERVRDSLPSLCAVCHAWGKRPVCDDCIARFAQPLVRCRSCALPLPGAAGSRERLQCGACLRNPPPLDECIAAVSYAYPWDGLITRFKFHAHPGLAHLLASLLRSAPWAEPALDTARWLLPMPLATGRLRERGFNQAHELAKHLTTGPRAAVLDANMLLRIRETAAQNTLRRSQRLSNVRAAFAIDPLRANLLRGQRVVIVDDVMTSAASIHAAATVVREAGAASITALVVARTDEPGD